MTLLKTALMASALILSPAAFAQDAMTDKAKDVAVDVAKDKAKDMAADKMGDKGSMVSDKAIDVGADMVKGKSMKDAAMGTAANMGKTKTKDAIMGESPSVSTGGMTTGDAMTAGKVMVKGGSAEDAAKAVAKERAKDAVTDNAKKMMHKGMGQHQGTVKSVPMMNGGSEGTNTMMSTTTSAPPAAMAPINCPYGTTAQPNGTCMITGDYQPRS